MKGEATEMFMRRMYPTRLNMLSNMTIRFREVVATRA